MFLGILSSWVEKGERGGKKILIERPQINTIQKTFKTSNKSAVTTYRWRVDKNPSKVLSLQTAISVVRASVLSFLVIC